MPPLDKEGFVYFATTVSDEYDAIKIGHTAKPEQRLKTLETYLQQPVRYIGYYPATAAHEKKLHEVFASRRLWGEWYYVSILKDVRKLLSAYNLNTVVNEVIAEIGSKVAHDRPSEGQVRCRARGWEGLTTASMPKLGGWDW